MGNLKKTDFIVSLIFGCVISLLCFQFQSAKKSNRSTYKKENQQRSLTSQQNAQQFNNFYALNSKYPKKRKPVFQNNRAPSSIAVEDENEEHDDYMNPENEFSADNARAQLEHEMSLKMNEKIENYLLTQIGLPSSEIAKVFDAKRYMEDEIHKNNNQHSILNSTEEIKTELKLINQQILSNYQEVLKQILGPENYQRYANWQNEQDAAISESYAGGRPMAIDEI